uniref:Ribosomal protein L13 n=1 Tax=Chroomonas placoidea TaxID=173977 RepID=A0A222AID6_9CRYP|nr:ribosomal protein L13 [Chroomonas placoidea]ASO76131.1 ribosomal protein L13 [Chroomonas placoidea]
MNKTILNTTENETYKWYLIDAESKKLGRLSSEISKILLGKNAPEYSPNHNIRHSVIVINAEKVEVTGKKRTDKFYRRHSGRPGGLTIETFQELQDRIPTRIIEKSVKGMLPKTRLGRTLFSHLKVYSGNVHPHISQKPELLTLD